MDFIIAREAALRLLRIVAPALARGHHAEADACALRATTDGVILHLTGFDWDIRCTSPARVATPGQVWISRETLRAVPWPVIGAEIAFSLDAGTLIIRSSAGTYTTQVCAAPTATGLRPGPRIIGRLDGAALSTLLRLGSLACAGQGDSDSTVRGVWLRTDERGARLTCDAWNGAWLSRASVPVDVTAPLRLALPVHAALVLAQAARLHEHAAIATNLDGTIVTIAAGEAALTALALAAAVPNPEHADVPAGLPVSMTLQAGALAQAARCTAAVAGTDPYARIHLTVRHDGLHVVLPYAPEHGRLAGFATCVPGDVRHTGSDVVPIRQLVACALPMGDSPVDLRLGGRQGGTWITGEAHNVMFTARLGSLADPSRRAPAPLASAPATLVEAWAR